MDDYAGLWYGGAGSNEIQFYRVSIEPLDNAAEYQVRELDELKKPWVSANPLERLRLIGFEVDGGAPISMTWAGPGNSNPIVVAEAFFLPRHKAEFGRGVSGQLTGAVTGRGLSAPLFYDDNNDRLISSEFLPCFYRTMEQAKARSMECVL